MPLHLLPVITTTTHLTNPPCSPPTWYLRRMANELEASKAAAVKSVKDLQARLALEHAQMLKLQVCGQGRQRCWPPGVARAGREGWMDAGARSGGLDCGEIRGDVLERTLGGIFCRWGRLFLSTRSAPSVPPPCLLLGRITTAYFPALLSCRAS